MAGRESTGTGVDWKAALLGDEGFRALRRITVQEVLAAEVTRVGSWSCRCRRIGRVGFQPRCANGTRAGRRPS